MRIPAPLITVFLAAALIGVIVWQGADMLTPAAGVTMPSTGVAAQQNDSGALPAPVSTADIIVPLASTQASVAPQPSTDVAAQPVNVPPAPEADSAQLLPTGSSAPMIVAQADSQTDSQPDPQAVVQAQPAVPLQAAPAAAPQSAPAANKPTIDESALRYFASQGDTRRLNAEIARLRSLYPDWVPPDDPLKGPPVTDLQLDNMWKLYSRGQFAAARAAIAARQTGDPGWKPPADLLDRLAVAETRERLVNASNAKQYKMVVDLATKTPSLLTCGDIDVLWRLAEAFARTDRQGRTEDTYRYILTNCTDTRDRLSTMQKATVLLSRSEIDPLLALGHSGAEGDEFRTVREDLARNAIVAGGADPKVDASAEDIQMLENVAQGNHSPSDPLLLGNYLLQHGDPTQAEHWFRISFERQNTAQSAEGLALALIALKRPAEAETVLFRWHDANDGAKKSYMAAVANLLAQQPPPQISPDVLARIVPAVAAQRDAASAQQLGWYSHAFGQEETAARWFAAALSWKPDDEPSAYGLAVVDQTLNRRDPLRSLVRVWASRSLRIRALIDPVAAKALAAQQAANGNMPGQTVQAGQPQQYAAPPVQAPASGQAIPVGQTYTTSQAYPTNQAYGASQAYQASQAPVGQPAAMVQAGPPAAYPSQMAAPNAPAAYRQAAPETDIPDPYRTTATGPAPYPMATEPAVRPRGAPRRRNMAAPRTAAASRPGKCSGTLPGGWCLMNLNRPAEAITAFRAALETGSPKDRQDAAYGLSLAYLRLGLTSEAAAASTQAPQPGPRTGELGTAILTQRITSDYQAGRYAQVLIGLDARSRIAPEQTDLMMMRGWSYYHLQRYGEAQQVFQALAAAGRSDATQGLTAIRDVKRQR